MKASSGTHVCLSGSAFFRIVYLDRENLDDQTLFLRRLPHRVDRLLRVGVGDQDADVASPVGLGNDLEVFGPVTLFGGNGGLGPQLTPIVGPAKPSRAGLFDADIGNSVLGGGFPAGTTADLTTYLPPVAKLDGDDVILMLGGVRLSLVYPGIFDSPISVTLGANALVRLREKTIASAIETDGTTVIDNADSNYKSTSGRGDAGERNGTLSVDDIWFAYRQAIDAGHSPNAFIVHPSAWNIFLADESMRKAFDLDNGRLPLYMGPQGEAGGTPWHSSTPSLTQQAAGVPGELATLRTGPNTMFPGISRIIPSAYMSWVSTTKRATIALVDTNNCGVVQQASSSPEIEEFRDLHGFLLWCMAGSRCVGIDGPAEVPKRSRRNTVGRSRIRPDTRAIAVAAIAGRSHRSERER